MRPGDLRYREASLRFLRERPIVAVFLCVALSIPVSGADRPALTSSAGTPIADVVTHLLNTYPQLRVGWERLPLLDDTLDEYQAPQATETEESAVRRVSALVEKHTDYVCKFSNHWLILAPTERSDWNDKPLIRRVCKHSEPKKGRLGPILSSVEGVSSDEPVILRQDLDSRFPSRPEEAITLDPATRECSELLCAIAEQLLVRHWRVSHLFLSRFPGTLDRPLDLRGGLVGFSVELAPEPPSRAAPSESSFGHSKF